MFKIVTGVLEDVVNELNSATNESYRLVQIIPRGTTGNVQAILYKEDVKEDLETILKELQTNIETSKSHKLPWYKRWFK